jgi:hypothetical protein
MDLDEKIADLARRAAEQSMHLQTEEATKNGLVMPMLASLGYDVFDPFEVVPEFTADVGTKKGEKVDYAIFRDGVVSILIECKKAGVTLDSNHASQLFRYFTVTDARFAVLTNGIEYHFYTDIDTPNRMDSKPFFKFDVLNYEEHQVEELKKFRKSHFSMEQILETASTLKYAGAIKRILGQELESPSEAFVRFFASQVYDGRITQQVLDQFTTIVLEARAQFINEQINERLKSALKPAGAVAEIEEAPKEEITDDGIVTTEDEVEAYQIVRAILRQVVGAERVAIRDTKSYCGVLLDDNNRKPICRLHFNHSQKYLGLFTDKVETRVPIESINDIFQHADAMIATVKEYVDSES